MGITHYDGRVERALWLKNKDIWCAIGRTTAWPNENIPLEEAPGDHTIDEAICYVRPELVKLVAPVPTGGDVTVNGQDYAFVDDIGAYEVYARYVYIRGLFDPTENPEQPHASFRQHAVYSGLVPASGHENDQWLAPANVTSPGIIEYSENHTVVSLSGSESREIEIIIECR